MRHDMDNRIRIVHIMGEFPEGGTERTVLDLLCRLDKKTFDIHVFCTASDGLEEARRRLCDAGITTLMPTDELGLLNGRGGSLGTTVRKVVSLLRLAWKIKKGGFTIAHTHGPANNVFGRSAAILAGTPVIITHEHDATSYAARNRALWKLLNLRTSANIAASSAVSNLRTRFVPSSQKKSITLLNGIDMTEFRPPGAGERAAAKEYLGLDPRRKVVGAVSARADGKGVDLFLRASALLAQKRPDVQFLVAGDDGPWPEQEGLSAMLGVKDRVKFARLISEREKAFWAMDVFLTLSDTANRFGLSTAEAMACGLAIVALDSPLYHEIVSGDCGILVTPEPEDVAGATIYLLDDETLTLDLGKAAVGRASRRYDIARSAGELQALYENMVNRRHNGNREHARLTQ